MGERRWFVLSVDGTSAVTTNASLAPLLERFFTQRLINSVKRGPHNRLGSCRFGWDCPTMPTNEWTHTQDCACRRQCSNALTDSRLEPHSQIAAPDLTRTFDRSQHAGFVGEGGRPDKST